MNIRIVNSGSESFTNALSQNTPPSNQLITYYKYNSYTMVKNETDSELLHSPVITI